MHTSQKITHLRLNKGFYVEKNKKVFKNVKPIILGLARGKSIYRIVFDEAVKNINGLKGMDLDIGSVVRLPIIGILQT